MTGFGGDALDVFGDFEAVDTVDEFEERQRVADFVFLEVAYEVPGSVARDEGNFGPGLLDSVFAKDANACAEGFADSFRGMGF